MEPYLVIRISAAGTISSYIDTPRPALHFVFEAQLQRRVKMSHCRRAGRGLTDSESLICDEGCTLNIVSIFLVSMSRMNDCL